MKVFILSSVSIITSLSGSLRIISKNNFASIAIIPPSAISPSMIVSMPRSISFAVSLMIPFVASTNIHSRIGIVVLLDTAFDTICTPFNKLDFLHIIFMFFKLLQNKKWKK